MSLARPYHYHVRSMGARGADSLDHGPLTTQLDAVTQALNDGDQLVRTRIAFETHVAVVGSGTISPLWWKDLELYCGVYFDPTGNVGTLALPDDPSAAFGPDYHTPWVVQERHQTFLEVYSPSEVKMIVRTRWPVGTLISEARRNSDSDKLGTCTLAWTMIDRSGKVNTNVSGLSYWMGYQWQLDTIWATSVPPL